MNDISAILQKIQEDARQYGENAAAAAREGRYRNHLRCRSSALASSFLWARLPCREIMIRWAWGEPAPCMDSVR